VVGDEEFEAPQGAFVIAPRGIPHTLWSVTDDCLLLSIYSPSRYLAYIEATASVEAVPDRRGYHLALEEAMRQHDSEWFDPFPD
jgi:hypothetical protein